jgi:BirA family biotin operon repressor/biotin-[acetyl-CoA-carboxylase] ligase
VLDSTNRYLVDEAAVGAAEGLVALAGFQTAGKGRLGRRWDAPAGANLLASVLLRPDLDPGDIHLLTVAVALAASDACEEVADVRPALKWPNDLYVGKRKLAGILAESVARRDAERAVVVGLGLNLRWPPPSGEEFGEQVPRDLESTATSLWRESASDRLEEILDPIFVLRSVLSSLERWLRDLSNTDGHRRLAEEYRRRCATIGKRVSVSLSGETIEGTAIDITDQGHLVVDAGAGPRTITAGDVVHLD